MFQNDKKGLGNYQSDAKTKKRRALGDVMNLKQQQQQQQNKNVNKTFQTIKDDQCKPQNQEETIEEVEFNHGLLYSDKFQDILNEKQKLSNILLNAKCIPLLPTHSIGEIVNYNDAFHSEHVISDKKLKRNIKKEGNLQLFI